MLSKNKIKLIKSLDLKKNRLAENLFIVEGTKIVLELLNSEFKVASLYLTEGWLNKNQINLNNLPGNAEVVTAEELQKISFLKTPQEIIALAEIPEYSIKPEKLTDKLSLALDTVQDPGNLGTIIRIADWFGIENIFCSMDSADVYNPKVVQSTMGAFLRVKVHYVSLEKMLSSMNQLGIPIFGTFLDGENIYSSPLTKNGVIAMGNESNGISPGLASLIQNKILIPNYSKTAQSSESLNVGVATAIVCAEFRRRN